MAKADNAEQSIRLRKEAEKARQCQIKDVRAAMKQLQSDIEAQPGEKDALAEAQLLSEAREAEDRDTDEEREGDTSNLRTFDPRSTPTQAEKTRRKAGTDPKVWQRWNNDKRRAHKYIAVERDEASIGDFTKGEPAFVIHDRNMKTI